MRKVTIEATLHLGEDEKTEEVYDRTYAYFSQFSSNFSLTVKDDKEEFTLVRARAK